MNVVTEHEIATVLLADVAMDVDQFVHRTREGLTVEDSTRQRYEYFLRSVGKTADRMLFEWRFPIDEANSLIKMKGQMELERAADPKPVIQALIDQILQEKDSMQQQRDEVTRINEHLRQQQKVLTSNLDKLRADKELMHAEMISKFVELLNEKKKKIRSLKEELLKRPERMKPGENDDDDDSAALHESARRRAAEPRVAPSLALGSLSMGQSQASSSLDLLAVSPDHAIVKPSIRKRQRLEPNAADTAMDLQSVVPSPKRVKPNPQSTGKPPVAQLKAPASLVSSKAQVNAKQMIVDDEGSAPPARAPAAPAVSYGSPNPSPSYGESRMKPPKAKAVNNSRVEPSSARQARSVPKEPEDAENLFGQIE